MEEIRRTVHAETNLTVSAGIAPNMVRASCGNTFALPHVDLDACQSASLVFLKEISLNHASSN